MKFTVTMKSPDALDYATEDMDEDEKGEARNFAKKYMTWGEYIDVEFDTDAKTVKVLKAK